MNSGESEWVENADTIVSIKNLDLTVFALSQSLGRALQVCHQGISEHVVVVLEVHSSLLSRKERGGTFQASTN